jgi:peptide/nickel transport system ATP-binding protein
MTTFPPEPARRVEPVPPDAVEVHDLRVVLAGSGVDVVEGVSFAIAPGEVLGVVGESGSGKTTVGLALLGHARRGLRIAGGSVRLGDVDVLELDDERRRQLRGRLVSYVPQDPASSLNPALRIGTQLREVLETHDFGGSQQARTERLAEAMREVALPDDAAYLRRYPHELSGGQQQRVGLAMAFACRPQLIVLDEPTTGLDVTTQAHVLDTVRELTLLHGVAALYVSHDLAVVATLARRVAVMYAGRVIELAPAENLFRAAGHPYTRQLIGAIPHLSGRRALAGIGGRAPGPGQWPDGCAFAPRCPLHIEQCDDGVPALRPVRDGHAARCIRAEEVVRQPSPHAGTAEELGTESGVEAPVLRLSGVSASYGSKQVVHDVDLDLEPQECLAVVGESGSGKTTLARSIAGLHKNRDGEIRLRDEVLAASARGRSREQRRSIQYVFQNPYGSLNPRRTVGQIIRQPIELFRTASGQDADRRVAEMLERVSLTAAYAQRYPDQLSGGERQRVAIARALVSEPAVLVCDEVTSALDVSVQAAIVNLLGGLQRDLGLSMLFVTHNLPLVRSIAQRVAVMSEGRIVELGGVEQVLQSPSDSYTRQLLADTPSLESAAREPVGSRIRK